MNKIKLLIIGGVLIVLVLGVAQFLSPRQAVSPTLPVATSTPEQNIATTTAPTTVTIDVKTVPKNPETNPLQLASGDNIVSWNFKGAYADNPELVAKAEGEIKRFSDILATATSSYMITAVGIANQYELLGDGKKQYEYLGRAMQKNPENGLPWHNLGVLMERLGALETARIAYEEATLVQSQYKQWHYAYLDFITKKMKDDIVDIERAFTAANKYFATDADIIQLRAEWEKP